MPGVQTGLLYREQVEDFRRRFRTGLVTLLFTDIVGSTKLKQTLGDRAGVALLHQHHAVVRELLREFPEGAEISTAGDSFFLVFVKPSDAVRFALLLQAQNRALTDAGRPPLQDRIGIHLGEVVLEQNEGQARDLHGLNVDVAARVMSLADAGQILLSRATFDSARQALKGEDVVGLSELSWLNHGPYMLKGVDEPVEICEVGETGLAPLQAPTDAAKAQRKVSADAEPVLGWRPALDTVVPNTQWMLEKKLGEGGFGEVWLGRHQKLKERRVFKFCFRADRVRSLKREMTLFRLIKERIGDHPNIVRLLEVNFEEPPYYVVMDHVEGEDLRTWCEQQGGADKVPLETRLEMVTQIADALQAAHDAGVIHRDVKPANILVSGEWRVTSDRRPMRSDQDQAARSVLGFHQPSTIGHQPVAKLTDFGIGQVVSAEALKGVTGAGFTQTIVADSSSSHTGSQMYLAPELSAGKPASTRSDIYSLGVVLYQLLVGDFTRPATTDWGDSIDDPLLRDDLKHCFAGNPQDRFAGAGLLSKNLRALPQRRQALAKEQAELAARERAAYRRGVWRSAGIAAAILSVVAVLALIAVNKAREARTQARRAEGEAQRAEQNAAEEKRQRGLVEERELSLRRNLYALEMNLAYRAWEAGDVRRARGLLDRQRPGPGQQDRRDFDWRLLWRLCQNENLLTFRGHTGFGQTVALSSDGITAATAGEDATIQLWHLPTRRVAARLTGHKLGIWALAFSPNGKMLASATGGMGPEARKTGELKLWDLDTRREIASLEGHKLWFYALAFSPDGKILASANEDGTVKLWDVDTRKERRSLRGHKGGVLCVAFSPDGKTVATAGTDGTARFWEVATEAEGRVFVSQTVPIGSMAFSRDGQTLALGSSDYKVQLWDRTSQSLRASLPASEQALALAFSPDGDRLAFGSGTAIKFWSLSRMEDLGMLRGLSEAPMSLAFSPDGRTLAVTSFIGEPTLWNAAPQPNEEILRGHKDSVFRVAFSPDDKILVTGSGDALQPVRPGEVKLWDVATRQEIETLPIDTGTIHSLAISPDRKTLAWGSEDTTIKLWDIASRPRRLVGILQGHTNGVLVVAFSPDGKTLASSGGRDLTVRLWDVATRQLKHVLQGHTRLIRGVAFTRDGQHLVTCAAGDDQTVRVWDVARGQAIRTWKEPGPAMGLAFSPEGKTLAVIVWHDVKLYEVGSWQELGTLQGHQDVVIGVAFTPAGRVLASASYDGTARLWNLATKQAIVTLRGHVDGVTGVAFSSDGTLLASAGRDKTVRLWLAPTFDEIQRTEEEMSRAKSALLR